MGLLAGGLAGSGTTIGTAAPGAAIGGAATAAIALSGVFGGAAFGGAAFGAFEAFGTFEAFFAAAFDAFGAAAVFGAVMIAHVGVPKNCDKVMQGSFFTLSSSNSVGSASEASESSVAGGDIRSKATSETEAALLQSRAHA